MRIDSHQHFWKYDPIRDSWIDDSMKVIRKDFLPKDLKPILEQHSVDGCIAVQADQSEQETEFLLHLAEENPFVKGVVGWVDLCSENVEEQLAAYASYKKFCGVRHIAQSEVNDFMLRSDFQYGISKLKKFGLTYDILIYSLQLTAAIALVRKFPDQPFVLDHMAKPNIKEGKFDQWESEIIKLAKSPNVYCKLSGMVTEADWVNWSKDGFSKYLDVVFSAFGIDRILYGSDWPVCLLAATYEQQLQIVETYISKFSAEDKAKVMGGNAMNFYKVK